MMDQSTRRNIVLDTVGEGLWGFQSAMVMPATVLTVLLSFYGASQAMVGGIAAVESAAMLLPPLLGVYLFRSRRQRKMQLILWHGLLIPMLPLMGLVAWNPLHLSPLLVRWALLLAFALFSGLIGAIVTVWMDWLASLFSRDILGTVMGISFCTSAVCGWAGAQFSARLIRAFHGGPAGYGTIYLLAAIIATISICTFLFIRDPAETQPEPANAFSLKDLLGEFRHSVAHANFRILLLGRLLGSFGFCIVPLVARYYTSPAGGELSGDKVVAASSVMFLSMALSNLALGRLGDRHGHRLGILIGTVMQLVTLALLLLVPRTAGCYLFYAGAGVCLSAGFVPHINLLLETCPHGSRQTHLAAANLLLAPGAVGAPLLAGFAAEHVGLRCVFGACIAFSFATLVWMILFFKEPRTLEPGVAAREPLARG